jgi:hypothetical protein
MASVSSIIDDLLPTSAQVAEVRGRYPYIISSLPNFASIGLELLILRVTDHLLVWTLQVQKFLGELEGLKTQLESKKAEAQKVIRSKMKDLHQLIDKWETRFLDTMAETLDEKIEGVTKQVRYLNLRGWKAGKRFVFLFIVLILHHSARFFV